MFFQYPIENFSRMTMKIVIVMSELHYYMSINGKHQLNLNMLFELHIL